MILPLQLELVEKLNPDSLAVKREVVVETIRNTPPDQLLHNLGQQAIHFGLKVLAALAIYIVGAWLIKLVKNSLQKGFQKKNTEPTLASFTQSLVTISMWVILIIITVTTLGINTTSIAALLAAGGMAVGMALSGTVQNFAGGIMILIFKPFKAGDFIEAQGFSGVVKEVNIVSTKLRTTDNKVVILPNGALSNGNITNVNTKLFRRVEVSVGVEYGTDAAKAKEALLEIMESIPAVEQAKGKGKPDPFVALSKLESSNITFLCRCWVNTDDYWDTYFRLNEDIYTLLPSKYGINFPFPQMDVHIKN